MEFNELDKVNLDNLTSLWKVMGVRSDSALSSSNHLNKSLSWPHRCWFDREINNPEISSIDNFVSDLENDCIIPIWDIEAEQSNRFEQLLIDEGFKISFKQSAMYLDIKEYKVIDLPYIDLKIVKSVRDIDDWTKVAIQSFEYEIDVSVIRKIANDPDVRLLIVKVDDQSVATAMIYKTGEVIGIHQVGVSRAFRGKGIAQKLMRLVIAQCIESPCKYITLQASTSGQSLYEKLGFRHQFIIRNYKRELANNKSLK